MLDNEFDPYQALVNLDTNVKNLIFAHNALAKKVEEQQAVIDALIKGLDASNRANEHLLLNMVDDISHKLKGVK
jgi:hypothetical protein